jgi:hypothetical protein
MCHSYDRYGWIYQDSRRPRGLPSGASRTTRRVDCSARKEQAHGPTGKSRGTVVWMVKNNGKCLCNLLLANVQVSEYCYPDRTYLITYLLLTYSVVQDIIWKADCHSPCQKNILLSYGTGRFITVFTQAYHWTLSWASWIQFTPSIPISLTLMLSSHLHLGLPSGLLPSGLPTKTL